MRTATTLVLAAGVLGALWLYGARPRSYGSPTNASDEMDKPEIAPGADCEEALDVAVQYTFPASDPISIDTAYANRA